MGGVMGVRVLGGGEASDRERRQGKETVLGF